MKEQQPIDQRVDQATEAMLTDAEIKEAYEAGIVSRAEADVYQILVSTNFGQEKRVQLHAMRQRLWQRMSTMLRLFAKRD